MTTRFDYSQDFSLKPGHIWLNVASEGPLPKAAALALQESVQWKSAPHLLTISKFHQVPLELKQAIAQLIHVDPKDVILGNSATYGVHLLANGLALAVGDEVIVMQNDFPTDILPWLSLVKRGVKVRQLKPKHHVLSVDEISAAINAHTKVICLPHVHSFSGFKEDIAAIGTLCRTKGILVIVNVSQTAGVMPLDVSHWPVDAVVCAGYKWLLGPYGTGFCWIRPQVREQLDYPQNYWISLMDEESLSSDGPMILKEDHSARRYDIFGTANFFNYVPWKASIEYLLSIGINTVEKHNQGLVDQIIEGLDPKRCSLISPHEKSQRTNIVVFSYKDPSRNRHLWEYLNHQGLYLALWKGQLRVSPHIYNTSRDIETFLESLRRYDPK